jgi:hypothetical protein
LRIETGRYELCGLGSKRGLPIEYRVCRCCDLNKVEDEIHFLLECPRFVRARGVLMNVCEKEIHDFVNVEDSVSVFQAILKCQNHNVCSALAMYVRKSYTERYKVLQSLLCKDESKC